MDEFCSTRRMGDPLATNLLAMASGITLVC